MIDSLFDAEFHSQVCMDTPLDIFDRIELGLQSAEREYGAGRVFKAIFAFAPNTHSYLLSFNRIVYRPLAGCPLTLFGFPVQIEPSTPEGEIWLKGDDGQMLRVTNIKGR